MFLRFNKGLVAMKTILTAVMAITMFVSAVKGAEAQSEYDFLKDSLRQVSQDLKQATTPEERAACLICRAIINRNLRKMNEFHSDLKQAVLLNPAVVDIAFAVEFNQ